MQRIWTKTNRWPSARPSNRPTPGTAHGPWQVRNLESSFPTYLSPGPGQLMTQSTEPSSAVFTIGHSLVSEPVRRPDDWRLAFELAGVEAACSFRIFITSRVISRQACH